MENKFQKIRIRLFIISFGVLIFSFFLIFKIFYIQIHEGSYYKKLAKERTLKNFEIQASRGNIYSDDNSLLATSVTKYEIRWDSKVASQKLINNSINELSKGLSEIFKKPKSYYLNLLKEGILRSNRYLLIERNVNYSDYKKVKTLPIFNLPSYKGGLIVE